jgi:hypothetical protein
MTVRECNACWFFRTAQIWGIPGARLESQSTRLKSEAAATENPWASIEGGAEFEDAVARVLDRLAEWELGGGVEKQRDAIERAFADRSCQR